MDERERDSDYVDREEAAAAAEAARIGGGLDPHDEGVDTAERPLREAGEGEAEGFELAEEELIEYASHEDHGPDPTHMAAEPEEESDRSTAVDAEADEYRSAEREDDDY